MSSETNTTFLRSPAAHGGAQASVEFDHHQLVQHRTQCLLVPRLGQAGVGQNSKGVTEMSRVIRINFNNQDWSQSLTKLTASCGRRSMLSHMTDGPFSLMNFPNSFLKPSNSLSTVCLRPSASVLASLSSSRARQLSASLRVISLKSILEVR